VKKIVEDNLKDPEFCAKMLEYCQIDVTSMREIFFAFFKALRQVVPVELSDLKSTLPSTALFIYRKYFIPNNLN